MNALFARIRAWRPPAGTGPTMLLLVSAAGIAAVLWGIFFADPDITVFQYDAGPVEDYEVRQVNAFPEIDLYLYGLDSGGVRALDGRVESSGCTVRWLPDDARGRVRNPGGLPGVLDDRCSGALWSVEGNAISGTNEPLRTPHVTFQPATNGKLHVIVELINHPLGKR